MAASYEVMIVPSHMRKLVIDSIDRFLSARGFRIRKQQTQQQPGEPLELATNKVLFVGRYDPTSAWLPVSAWASEMGVDRCTWYASNPLAAKISVATRRVVFLWTLKAGLTAGFGLWLDGERRELQVVGELGELQLSEDLSAGCSQLAACLKETGFDYREFMARFDGDNQLGTAALAAKFGLNAHLIDIMDLIDGEGAIAVENGEYKQVDLLGWTAITFDRRPVTA